MTANASFTSEAFREIRDRALLVSVGCAYLCEPPFLSKFARELEHAISLLERDIRRLKKRFPGRFANEVDTDKILDGMRDLAGNMKAPETAFQQKCAAGELGQDLEDRLKMLSDAIQDVERQVDGAPADYSGREAVAGALSRAGGAVRSGFGVLAKVVGVVLLALSVAFGYLFVTMEREAGIEKEIARQEQQVQALQKELSIIEQEEITPLEDQIEALEREGHTRRHKVRLMELSVQRDQLEEKAGVLQGKIEQHRRSIQAAEESLRVLKEKGFFERLLRQ